MPINNGRVTNQRTTIDSVAWTAIVAPIDCNTVDILNVDATGAATSVVLKIRTDSTFGTSERRYGPGASLQFGGPFTAPHNDNERFRFLTGAIVGYAQLASGSYSLPQSYY